ncbi:MAG: ribosome silencing factor [Endomicrobium sp.]|jgi:ribosome-associated protein|nr:ribosome silencing factor [Endomicrobium sp.]
MAKIDFLALAKKAAEIADDKKALNTIILDVRSLTEITNYFVITTAHSIPQINAVCMEIEKIFKEKDMKILRRDGTPSAAWRVLDYGGLVVHIMSEQSRQLYNLERLWSDAKIVKMKIPVIKVNKPKIAKKIEKNFSENVCKGRKVAKNAVKAIKKKKQNHTK